MIDILDKYPDAKNEYLNWLWQYHKVTENMYAGADPIQQALGLKVWLGYEQRIIDDLDKAQKEVTRLLIEFVEARKKFPDPKLDDPIYQLQRMDFRKREKMEQALFNLQGEANDRISLRDAFDFSKLPIDQIKQEQDSEFWNNVVQGGEAPF